MESELPEVLGNPGSTLDAAPPVNTEGSAPPVTTEDSAPPVTTEDSAPPDISEASPPSPKIKKINRRSSVAIARRLSRASTVSGISLEDQLRVIPGREEATTQDRLAQVVSLCVRSTLRRVDQELRDNEENEDNEDMEDMEDAARTISNEMRQNSILEEQKLAQLAATLDSSAHHPVDEKDLLSSKVKAIREYTAKLESEMADWKQVLRERNRQDKNTEANLEEAKKGKIKVDDSHRFSLTSEEKAFFLKLPNTTAAMAQVARHEARQAFAAKRIAQEALRLRSSITHMESDLTAAAQLLGHRAQEAEGGGIDLSNKSCGENEEKM